MAGARWHCCNLCACSLDTKQLCTSLQCHFIQSHRCGGCLCLAVTCCLHFWQMKINHPATNCWWIILFIRWTWCVNVCMHVCIFVQRASFQLHFQINLNHPVRHSRLSKVLPKERKKQCKHVAQTKDTNTWAVDWCITSTETTRLIRDTLPIVISTDPWHLHCEGVNYQSSQVSVICCSFYTYPKWQWWEWLVWDSLCKTGAKNNTREQREHCYLQKQHERTTWTLLPAVFIHLQK